MDIKISKLTLSLILPVTLLLVGCKRVDTEYYENGQKKFEIPYTKGKINGIAKWWYPDGKLQQLIEYSDGKKDGKQMRWYNHGIKEAETGYRNDKKNGLEMEWNRTGYKIREQQFRNDTLDGIVREFYENQQLKFEGYHKNGLWHGQWIYWDDLGYVIGSGDFIDGKGVIKTWNIEGNITEYVEIEDNLKHGFEIFYGNDGKVIHRNKYENGILISEE